MDRVPPAKQKFMTRVEWAGTIVTLPSYVSDGGEPYHPEAMIWVDVETGLVVGTELGRPGEALASACDILLAAIKRDTPGASRRPSHARVDRPDLAAALEGQIAGVAVSCAPVPELAPVIASLNAHFAGANHEPETHFGPDVSPALAAAAFNVAAALYRVQPWSVVPTDCYLTVSCEALGIERGVMTVVGQLGETFGVGIFPTFEEFETFLSIAGGPGPIPLHYRLDYETKQDLGTARAREVAREGWKIAGPRAYPVLSFFDGDRRMLSARELVAMNEILAALHGMITRDGADVSRAWSGGVPITHRRRSDSGDGIEVTLVAPEARGSSTQLGDNDVDVVVERFLRAPEGKGREPRWVEVFLECAADELGLFVEELGPEEVEEIVLAIFPHSVEATGKDAAAIVDDVRALIAFAVREHATDASRESLELLDLALAVRLARALEDPSQFGQAKLVPMAGRDAGFDMDTEAGIEAYLRSMTRAKPRRTAKKPPAKKPRPRKR